MHLSWPTSEENKGYSRHHGARERERYLVLGTDDYLWLVSPQSNKSHTEMGYSMVSYQKV